MAYVAGLGDSFLEDPHQMHDVALDEDEDEQEFYSRPPPPDSPFNLGSLPHDIHLCVLEQLDSFHSLRNVLLTSRVFPQVFMTNPTGICTAIARREFSREALQVLNLWRPGAMKPFARRHMKQYSGLGDEDSRLSKDPNVIGLEEAKRLVEDRMLVRHLTDSFRDMTGTSNFRPRMGRVAIMNYSAYTPDELDRIQLGIYSAMLLAPCFHSRQVADRAGENLDVDKLQVVDRMIDWTPLLELPLANHLSLLAICHQFMSAWSWLQAVYGGSHGNPQVPNISHLLYPRLRGSGDWKPERWSSNKKARHLSERYDKYAGEWLWDCYQYAEKESTEYKKWLDNEKKAAEHVATLIEKKKERIFTIDEEGSTVQVTVLLK